MTRVVAAAALVLALLGIAPGCALTCKNWVTHQGILDTWMGEKLTAYEQRNNYSPISAMVRPEHRHEYKYLVHQEYLSGKRDYCYDYIEADDDTGKITGSRSEGNDCEGYCAD